MTNDGSATFSRCEIGLFNGVVVNDLDTDGDSELLTTTSIDDALHPLVWVRDP